MPPPHPSTAPASSSWTWIRISSRGSPPGIGGKSAVGLSQIAKLAKNTGPARPPAFQAGDRADKNPETQAVPLSHAACVFGFLSALPHSRGAGRSVQELTEISGGSSLRPLRLCESYETGGCR